MRTSSIALGTLAISTVVVSGLFLLHGQDLLDTLQPEDVINHANCPLFDQGRGKFTFVLPGSSSSGGPNSVNHAKSALTQTVMRQMSAGFPSAGRTFSPRDLTNAGTIDTYIFGAIQAAGVTPAAPTTDSEFIRRVTLDLTGRTPLADRVAAFLNDTAPDKRAKLVEELLASTQYVDKWTMFFGDLLKNNSQNTQIRRYDSGRNAFYQYIKASIAANKPYDQMARELISAQGTNSYDPTQGQINFVVGGVVTGGPVQDIWDQQAANIADTFLGIAHMNCLLCHNGRGHLDSLSLWASGITRSTAWQFASFLSHTNTSRAPAPGAVKGTPYYWLVEDNTKYKTDYPLNTTTGNRPARQPTGSQTTVAPVYFFNGGAPNSGENHRAALARLLTADFQFARASVNYMWEQFFGIGLVSPSDQFDPARLDPNNPPPAPWTLQPSNPQLLNSLAQDFINSGYDLKALMREIVNSQAYQLSARYDESAWNPAWETLFARKLVRRLWAEEIHDSIAQSSNLIPSYMVNGIGTVNWAMQFPETFNMPNAASPITPFLDAFLRGNRDDEPRRGDGSISQALGLMNNSFVMNRTQATGSGPTASLLAKYINLPDDQMVNNLFLAVLSRYPTAAEMTTALANLKSGTRSSEAENLLWELYNKVDFIFNY